MVRKTRENTRESMNKCLVMTSGKRIPWGSADILVNARGAKLEGGGQRKRASEERGGAAHGSENTGKHARVNE